MTSDAGQLSDRSIMCQGLAWKGRGGRGREGEAGREGGRKEMAVLGGREGGLYMWEE